MAPATPESVIRSWFDEVWNQGSEDAIDRLLSADGVGDDLPESGKTIRGPAEFKPFFRKFREALPDMQIVVTQTVTEGDRVAALCDVTGTHQGGALGPPTGRPVRFKG